MVKSARGLGIRYARNKEKYESYKVDPYPEIELARTNDRKRTFYDARFMMSNTNECTSSFEHRQDGTFVDACPDSSRQVRSFVFVHVLCLIQVYRLPGLCDGMAFAVIFV